MLPTGQKLEPELHNITIYNYDLWFILTILLEKHGSLALSIKVFKKIYLKMKSLKIIKYSQLQKNFGNAPTKRRGKDGTALFFATKY